MATSTSSSDVHEKAGGTDEQTHPKRGLRGSLASAGERVRRALAGNRAKAEDAALAAVTGTHPVTPAPQVDVDEARASVRALARSLLHQDRTGEPLEPTETAEMDAEEPKTTPRAKSVPPPLPKPRVSDDAQENVSDSDLAASDTSLEADVSDTLSATPAEVVAAPAVSSRSAQLRARLAAAKAQRAETQARLLAEAAAQSAALAAGAQAFAENTDSAEDSDNEAESAAAASQDAQDDAEVLEAESAEALDEIESADGLLLEDADAQSGAVSAAADDSADAAATTTDDLDEFEDLEAAALVEDPAPAREIAT
mgnify:CR=1 FL=1